MKGVLQGDRKSLGTTLRLALDERSTGYPTMLTSPHPAWAGATVVLRDGRLDKLTREFDGVMAAFLPFCDPAAPRP